MPYIRILTLLALQVILISSQSNDKICTEELDLLADTVSNFTRCAVNNASPFTFCRYCYKEFDTVRGVKSIVYDKHYDCVKELVESERYQIVKRVYDFANTLWEGSFCYNCFESKNIKEVKKGEAWVLKSGVMDFFKKHHQVDECFRNHTETSESSLITNQTSNITISNITNIHIVCTKCIHHYNVLNGAYHKLIKDMGGYVKENILCADVVSAMNSTRQRWSNEFNCVTNDPDTVSVVALTVLFCCFPVVFYIAAWLHGDFSAKRKNRHIPRIDYNAE